MSGRYSQYPPVVCLSAAAATGAGTALDCAGATYATFAVTGTLTSLTVTFEGSVDGTNYAAVPTENAAGSAVSTTTATGIFMVHVGALKSVRPNVTTYVSGNVTVTGAVTTAP
jgi:hypothetical protein